MVKGLLLLTLAAAAAAVLAACGGEGESAGSPTPVATTIRPTPVAPTPTPTAAPTPRPTPSPASEGAPFSLAGVQKAWAAKGLTVTVGGPSPGVSGLATSAVGVRLTRGADAMALAVLVYKDPQAAEKDWDLVPGQAPVLKAGRDAPARVSTWWNYNVVVVVLSASGGIAADA